MCLAAKMRAAACFRCCLAVWGRLYWPWGCPPRACLERGRCWTLFLCCTSHSSHFLDSSADFVCLRVKRVYGCGARGRPANSVCECVAAVAGHVCATAYRPHCGSARYGVLTASRRGHTRYDLRSLSLVHSRCVSRGWISVVRTGLAGGDVLEQYSGTHLLLEAGSLRGYAPLFLLLMLLRTGPLRPMMRWVWNRFVCWLNGE